jgi:hypothetical protein
VDECKPLPSCIANASSAAGPVVECGMTMVKAAAAAAASM